MWSTLDTGRFCGRAETDVKPEKFSYEWKIKNYESLPQKCGEYISSPIFRTENNEIEWQLSFYPHGVDGGLHGYTSIYLHALSDKGKTTRTTLTVTFCILPDVTSQSLTETFEVRKKYGFDEMTQRGALDKWRDESYSMSTIKIQCDITISAVITKLLGIPKCMNGSFDCQGGKLLRQALRPYYEEREFSDVAIIVGNRTFLAHKLVLAIHSEVFSAMFKNKKTQENLENRVKIEQMDPDVVQAMLEFFYMDEVTSMDESMAYGLLGAADKYNIERLRSMCEKFLYLELNPANAAKVLVHSELYHSPMLKEDVLEFIVNNFKDVKASESFEDMKKKYPVLLDELIDAMADQRQSKKRKLI